MKNKKFLIVNALIALLFITISILFLVLLDINKPGGIIIFLIAQVISLAALFWFAYYSSFKEAVMETYWLLAIPTYLFQLMPIIIFLLAGDSIINSTLIIIPILLIFILTIAYVVFIFLYTHYNKKAVAHDALTEAKQNNVQDESEYYNDDGSFKGSK